MLTKPLVGSEIASPPKSIEGKFLHLLPVIALAIDVVFPILIQYGIIPAQARWLSDLAVAAMLGLVLLYVLAFNFIPKSLLVIVAITVIWAGISILNSQGPLVTGWGWWQIFKYPFVGLFVYVYPGWPTGIAKSLPRYLVILLGAQVIVQILQYLSGVPIGDDLAGTFGSHGVGSLLFFTLLTLSMALGAWIANGDWKLLLLAFIFGIISSTLGENKLFAVALVLLALATAVIYLVRGEQIRRLFIFLVTLAIIFTGFIILYNNFASDVGGAARIETYLSSRALDDYLNIRIRGSGGSYNLGRNFGLQQGWNSIRHDPTTLLFGYGMGSRSESVSLGAVGQALSSSYYGLSVVSSLLQMLQEYGIVGLSLGLLFMVWFIFRLYHDAVQHADPDLNALRFGLILFTIFWPLWLWYATVWTMRAPMLIYWATVGYTLNREIVAYFDARRIKGSSFSDMGDMDTTIFTSNLGPGT